MSDTLDPMGVVVASCLATLDRKVADRWTYRSATLDTPSPGIVRVTITIISPEERRRRRARFEELQREQRDRDAR